MNCPICKSTSNNVFYAEVLKKHKVEFFQCSTCRFVFTERAYWLKEAYESTINLTDTGIIERNLYFSRVTSALIFFLFNKKLSFVDYAGGYGIFTRLMRDIGFDYFWMDPYCDNLTARGFEYKQEELKQIELLTAFEVFEHLQDPVKEISSMLKISKNIFFSTQLVSDPPPTPDGWWYYGLEHGQHISFYSLKSLETIAKNFGLNFYSFKGLHLMTDKRINFLIYKTIINLSNFGLFHLIKKLMPSRTWDDHLSLKK
ncbi:MAG: class I SAM-dependent methyltransferase [Ignavibacteriales bacterium]|nr:MAG: class I SAM-dependent methyltransferase [Ignavibacteriales bacterium]